MGALFGRSAVRLEEVPQTEGLYAAWACPDEGSPRGGEEYRGYIRRKWVLIAVCAAACFLISGLAVTAGDYPIGFFESYGIVWDHLTGNAPADLTTPEGLKDHVVWNLRLPRILVAIIAGAGLAIAGAAMQSTLKNPLADPYTTGISSGAAFGATVAICCGFGLFGTEGSIVVNAFVFALVPTAMIAVISAVKRISPVSMILAGMAVMYVFNAMTTVLMLWADPDDMSAVYRWQVGTFEGVSWDSVPVMLAVTLLGSLFLMFASNRMNVLASGDDAARSLGIDASRLRLVILVVVSLVAAAVVSFTGIIGFVGLVAPHVVRMFIGSDNRYLIPASAALGAAVLLVADLVGRTVIAPATLEVGVVTAFIGGPLFLYLVVRQRKEVW